MTAPLRLFMLLSVPTVLACAIAAQSAALTASASSASSAPVPSAYAKRPARPSASNRPEMLASAHAR